MELFDLLVLGGGPGGYLAAERAAQNGLKTAVFEERAFGGVCLNEGCIPTKTLLNSAKLYRHATESESFGVSVEGATFHMDKVIARKERVIGTLVGGVEATLKGVGVTMVRKTAVIDGKDENGNFRLKTDTDTYLGKRLIIATGSETAVPPIEGLKEGLKSGFVQTNREILQMQTLPKTLAVIGGGVIGLEMACFFAGVGVKVTVIEMMNKIAGVTDSEICGVLQAEYEKRGMEFCLGAKVLRVTDHSVVYEKDGKTVEVPCETVLLSAGRRARSAGIGLETLGVYTERGAIVTDEKMNTNVAGVYAVGDCNGKSMLAHTAYREAEVAVNNICGVRDAMRYDSISSVIYTDPEVACVGYTKEAAEKKGYRVKEVKVPMIYAGRYVAEVNNGKGFCKLVLDTERNRLLGVHMIGSYTSEMIYGAALMIDTELPPAQLKKLVFPHPTVCEVIREALFKL